MNWVPLRKGITVFACHVVTLFSWAIANNGIDAAQPFEKKLPAEYADASIEDISYSGKDEYRIVIVLSNRSSRDISVEDLEREFFVQTEKGWKRLEESIPCESPTGKNIHLPSGKTMKITTVVTLPSATEELFRTYEGDISFMFAYRLKQAGNNETRKNERLYWIRPIGTWIEREGM